MLKALFTLLLISSLVVADGFIFNGYGSNETQIGNMKADTNYSGFIVKASLTDGQPISRNGTNGTVEGQIGYLSLISAIEIPIPTPIPPLEQIGGNVIYAGCLDGTAIGLCSNVNPGWICNAQKALEIRNECQPQAGIAEERPILPSWWNWGKFIVAMCTLLATYYLWDEREELFKFIPEPPEEEGVAEE